jgi:hypothetical protein
MSMSLLPGLIGLTAGRSFSFYPLILGIDQNEWRYRRTTWSEIVVVNTHSGDEVCIPRGFVGDVSLNGPTAIVGLKREMEWRDGAAIPYRRPVVELPLAVNDRIAAVSRPSRPAPVVSIRLETHNSAKRKGRQVLVVAMLGVVVFAVAGNVARPGEMRDRFDALRVNRAWRLLTPGDNVTTVVGKLGQPAARRMFVDEGGRVFLALDYPDRHFAAVLAGSRENEARYVGTMDPRGRVLDAGQSQLSVSAAGMLRSAPRF